jgi:hypothetical protein
MMMGWMVVVMFGGRSQDKGEHEDDSVLDRGGGKKRFYML